MISALLLYKNKQSISIDTLGEYLTSQPSSSCFYYLGSIENGVREKIFSARS